MSKAATATESTGPVSIPTQPLFKAKMAQAKAKYKKSKPEPGPVAVVASSDLAQIETKLTTAVGAVGVPILGSAGTTYVVTLPAELAQRLQKGASGQGGWQRLMLELKAAVKVSHVTVDQQTIGGYVLELTPHLLSRMIPYAVNHGSGGYQGVIRWILCLALAQHKAAILGGN